MKTISRSSFCAGFVLGGLAILLSSSLANSFEKGGGIAGSCPADIAPTGGDGIVNVDDLLAVLSAWGNCTQCPPDQFEPNGTCTNFQSLIMFSDDEITYFLSIDDDDDVDLFRLTATEFDSVCGCPPFSSDEDYQLTITLTVPANAPGPVELCTGFSCATVDQTCLVAQPGQATAYTYTFDGSCVQTDSYTVWMRIKPVAASGCGNYQLKLSFDAGLCFD